MVFPEISNRIGQDSKLEKYVQKTQKTTFKTLIAVDATLILSRTASKTIQQYRICYQKEDATPHLCRCRSEEVN
jgi:hypothetical protein